MKGAAAAGVAITWPSRLSCHGKRDCISFRANALCQIEAPRSRDSSPTFLRDATSGQKILYLRANLLLGPASIRYLPGSLPRPMMVFCRGCLDGQAAA